MLEHGLKYHQPILDLLGVSAALSEERLAVIKEREAACGTSFPASVREWFAVEEAERLFYDNTNQDNLANLRELGVPTETGQGYLRVATENQGVVAWYVRLNGGDDPPVYDNNDEWNDDLSRTTWREVSKTFTAFIFDIISSNHFGGWYSGMHLSANDRMPDARELSLLSEHFARGPTTDASDRRIYRFFNRHGIITICSVTEEQLAKGTAEWSIEADTPDALFEFAQKVWQIGTLSETLMAESCCRESRDKGDEVLERLRVKGATRPAATLVSRDRVSRQGNHSGKRIPVRRHSMSCDVGRTTNLGAYITLAFLVAVGIVTGAAAGTGIYHAGRGWFGALFVGIVEGVLGIGCAYLLLQFMFRVVSFVRYWRHKRKR